MKSVQNFQFKQTDFIMDHDIKVYAATHKIQNKQYSLKKLSTSQVNGNLYAAILNEISILKQLNHKNIIKCHRMLKTSNSIYIVYDCYSGTTLQQLIQQGFGNIQKQSILRQIYEALSYLKSKHIIHLNLSPKCIHIGKNNIVKISGFLYADLLDQNIKQIDIDVIPPSSQFVAPQVLLHNKASYAGDAYSFGKIIKSIQLSNQQNLVLRNSKRKSRNVEIFSLINLLTKQDTKQRQPIQIYESQIRGKSRSSSRIKQADMLFSSNRSVIMKEKSNRRNIDSKSKSKNTSYSPLPMDKSLNSSKMQIKINYIEDTQKQNNTLLVRSVNLRDSSRSFISSTEQIEKRQRNQQIMLDINKYRNLSLFLLQLSETANLIAVENKFSTVFSYLLIKKSTKMLQELQKFLQMGKGVKIKLTDIERKSFFSTKDYYEISNIIKKELNLQKQQLSNIIYEILKDNDKQLLDDKFKFQLQTQKFDDEFMKNICIRYLKSICQKKSFLETIPKKRLGDISMMTELLRFGSYERLFQQLINQTILDLNQQTFVIYNRSTNQQILIKCIKQKLSQQR